LPAPTQPPPPPLILRRFFPAVAGVDRAFLLEVVRARADFKDATKRRLNWVRDLYSDFGAAPEG
jgi:hypothetical protein